MPDNPARVLIIDDDELISVALFHHLQDSGVSVDLAIDPDRAEALLVAHDYEVVLMDAYLTGQLQPRACELLDNVQRLRPASQIVLLTAYESPLLADHAKASKHVTVVPKPQSVMHLSEVIGNLLEART